MFISLGDARHFERAAEFLDANFNDPLTSPNGVVYTDPSTVPTIQAIAEATGHELPASYRTMTSEQREGEWLPEHLVAQLGTPEDH